ncbi:tetratricopeptide repeat protein [Winogradskyella maritima]|nr:tetratricopeptide repeat protein [Winogradskyella maritima]
MPKSNQTFINIQQSISHSYHNIGQINRILGQYDLATQQFKKALEIEESLKNKLGLAINYQILVSVKKHRACLKTPSKPTTRHDLEQRTSLSTGKIICNNGIAHIYVHQKETQKAVNLLQNTLLDAKKHGEHTLIAPYI